jgi:hypothetical protein
MIDCGDSRNDRGGLRLTFGAAHNDPMLLDGRQVRPRPFDHDGRRPAHLSHESQKGIVMHRLFESTALTLVLGVFAWSPAVAQDASRTEPQAPTQSQQPAEQPPIIALSDWNYDDIYSNGWSLERLIENARVYGAEGEEIGEVENVLLSTDGKILSVVAEVGGFLDIADTHVSVPWDQVAFSPALDLIEIPVDQENVEDYSLFGEWGYFTKPEADVTQVVNEELLTGPRVWKATDLIDDYALLATSLAYGYVDDLIFTNDGMLHAVVVEPDASYAGGPYAFPYYGYAYGWYPGSPYYALPYDQDEITVIDTFDAEKMSNDVAMTGTAGTAGEPATTGSIDAQDQAEDATGSEEASESAN